MRHSLRRLATALALALAACAKQQPLPVANFVGITQDALTVATGQQIILDGSNSASNSVDPAGAELTYAWSFVSLPAGSKAKIESPHNARTRFTADVPTSVTEKYVLSLVVKNRYFLSAPHLLTISALECGASTPQINAITAAPTSINIATPVLLTAAVDDKDNDDACQPSLGNVKQTEKYRWVLNALPPGSKAKLRDPGAVLAAFDPDVAGTYTATLRVTDSTGRTSDPAHIDVQVAACGGATPAINSINSSPTSPNLAQPTQLTTDVTDADNNPICGLNQTFTYAWKTVGLPQGSGARLNDPAAVNPSFTPDVHGDYSFTLVVTDSTGLHSAPLPFTVSVKDCGGAPPTPIVQFTPSSAGIGLPVSLKATPQDGDAACGISETFSYAWSLVTMPGGSQARIVAPNAATASLVPDVGGDYAIHVTITDSRGTSASALSHLTVAGCGNNAPSVDSFTGLPLTPLLGQNVHVTAQVSDADSSCAGFNPAETFRWTFLVRPAGSAAALSNPTSRAADFVPDVVGHYQLALVVTAANGLPSAPALFDVQTSTCGNSAPQIVSVGASNPSPDPGTPFTLFAQTFDPDNGVSCNLGQTVSLRWEVSSRPAVSSATLSDPAAATPSFTADVPGSYQFSVVATDSTGLSSTPAFFTLGTTNCGTAIPTVTAVPASIAVQPFQTVNFAATPFDADTSCGLSQTFTYAWRIVSAPSGSSAMLSNPGAAAPTFVPDLAGTYQLAVSVTDSRGHLSPEAFVTVSASACTTLPPVTGALSAKPLPPTLGSPITLSAPAAQATACFAPTASTALQFAWTLSRPAGSAALLDNFTSATPSFTPDVAGAYQVALVVRDSHGLSSTKAILNLNAAPCGTSNLTWNTAPELTPALTEPGGAVLTASFSGGVWTGAFTGTSVAMTAGFLDPPGCGSLTVQPISYQWALVSRPTGSAANLDSASAVHPSFVPDLPGDYQVAARVADATGAILPTRFVTVHVPGCGTTLPVAAITPPAGTTLNTFQTLHLTIAGGTATDADNSPTNCPARFAPGTSFSYAWSVSPSGATLASATGAATDFTAGAPGTYTVQLVATAANGLKSLPATLALTAGPCGSHPPSIASVSTTVGGASASRPLIGQTVTVTAFANAPDSSCGQSIASYNWTLASAPAGSMNAAAPGAGASFSFVPDVAGTYLFTVVATDSSGLNSAPDTVAVQTGACAPSVASIMPSSFAPAIGQRITLTSAAPTDSCVQAPAFAYAWSILSAPRGSTALLSSGTGTSTAFAPDLVGAYQFAVVATDQAGFSSAPATLQLSAGTCGTNPPALDPIAPSPSSFNAGDRLVLSSTLHDLNGGCGVLTQPYRWQWTLLSRPAGSTATLAQADVTPFFVPDLPGVYQVSAQATDALGNVSAAVFATLSTSSCGANPVTASILPAPSGPQLAATVNTPLALSASVDDQDNHACPASFQLALGQQWSILTAPAGAVATLTSTSTAATSFQANLPGTYVVGLTGTASNGLKSALATVSISATSCGANPPSVVSVSTGVSRPAVGSSVTLTANVFDLDNQTACQATLGALQTFTYAWRAVSLPSGANVSTAGAASNNFTFTAGVAGTYVFEVVATDSAGFSSATFRTSVATSGCGPALGTVAATGSAVGSPVNVSLSSASDSCVTSSTALAYFWSLASRPLTSNAAFPSPTAATNSFTPDVPGTYDVRVTVTDAGGFSSSADKIIPVGGCSAGPTVSINAPLAFYGGSPTSTLDRDDAVSLSATVGGGGCGAGTPAYTYAWSILGRPAGSTAQLSNASSAMPSFMLDVPGGTWQVMLVVRDQLGNASTAQFANLTTSTCGARPPVVAGLPATLATNTFQLQALSITPPSDPDAGCPARFSALPVSFAWSMLSQPAAAPAPTLSPSGGNASFTANFPGAYQVQVIARGSDGVSSAPTVVAVTAAQCGYNAPAIGTVSATQAAPGTAVAPFAARVDLAFKAAVTDADNAPGACGTTPAQAEFQSWLLISTPPGSVAQLTLANTSAPHLVPDLAGSYTVQVVASDSTGLSSSKSLTFAVGLCGTHAPTAGTLSAAQPLSSSTTLHTPAQLALGLPVIVDAPVITDGDTSCTPPFPAQYTYAWTMLAAPGSTARLSNASSATPAFVPDVTGLYTLALAVTDTTGLSSTSSLIVDVECGAAPPVAASFTAAQTVPSLNTNAGPVTNFQIVRSTVPASVVNGNVPFYPNLPVGLSTTVTDADASCSLPETFSYAWSLASAPPGSAALILHPTSATPSLVPDLSGEYDVQVVVTDSTGRSSTTVFSTSAPSTPFLPVGLCGIQAPQARIGVVQPVVSAAPVSLISVPVGSAVLLDGLPSHDGDVDPLLLTATNVPAGAAGAESGCGLSETFSYQWTVTAAPAALQPLAVAQANLSNPSFTASTAGNYGLTLTVSDGSRSGSTPIAIHARGFGSATVVASPANGSFIVGPANGATITTTVFDTDGNPLSAVPVAVAITAGPTGNTLTPTTGTTNGTGSFVALLTSTKAGGTATKNGETKTVQARSGSTVLGSASVNFAPGPLDHIDWFVQPCNVPAGTIIKCPGYPEVDGYDQYANVTTAYVSAVTLAVQQQPAGSTVGGTLLQNAGTAFNDLTVDKTGTYQFLATVPENLPGPTAPTTGPSPTFGVFSNTFNGTLPPAAAPNLTSSTATTPRQIVLNWDGSLNAANKLDKTIVQYHVFRATGAVTVAGGVFTDIAVTSIAGGACGGPTSYTPCTFTDTSAALTDGTVYTYYLEADNVGVAAGSCGTTSCSMPSNITQQFTMPAAATGVNMTNPDPAQKTIQVNWTAPSGTVSTYDVLRATTLTGTYSVVAGGSGLTSLSLVNGPSTTDTSLAVNTNYFYKIRSNITGSVSPATNPGSTLTGAGVQGTTLPPVPTLNCSACTGTVSKLSNSYNSIALTWGSPGGNATITNEIDRGTTTANNYSDAFTGVTGTSFTNSAAAGNLPVYPNVTYHYQLQVANAGGSVTSADFPVSTPSAPWSKSSSGLEGGWINALLPDPLNSVVYGGSGKPTNATTAAGVFKFSASSGAWAAINNGIPNGRVITSLAARTLLGAVKRLYAGTDGSGVLISLDNGLTWNPFGTGLSNANVTAVFLDSHQTVWAGTSTGAIYKLIDLTTAWSSTTSPSTQTVQAFAEDTHAPDTLYGQAFGGNPVGGLLSIDPVAGTTWALANAGLTGAVPDCSVTRSNASALAVDTVVTPSMIYWGSEHCGLLSRAAGTTTWTVVGGFGPTATVPASAEITRLVVDDTVGLNIWVAAAGSGVSYIKGATLFKPMTNTAVTNWEPTALAYDGTNLYAGTADGTGVYESINPTAGGSFQSFKTGLSNVKVGFLVNDPDNTHLVATGDQFGVAASSDQGAHWILQTLPAPGCSSSIAGLTYDGGNHTAFLTCQGVSGIFVGASNGTSWAFKTCTGLPTTAPAYSSGMAIFPGTTDTLYLATTAAGAATLWQTNASGSSIATTCTATTPALPSAVHDVTALVVDSGGDLFVGSTGNFVYTLATGGGVAWTAPIAATGAKSVTGLFFDSAATPDSYAAGSDGTTVGGVWTGASSTISATTTVGWTAVGTTAVTSTSSVTAFAGIAGSSAPILFAGTSLTAGQQYANLFRYPVSTDWSPKADGVLGGNVVSLVLPDASGTSGSSTVGIAGTSGGGIFKTTTGGQ